MKKRQYFLEIMILNDTECCGFGDCLIEFEFLAVPET